MSAPRFTFRSRIVSVVSIVSLLAPSFAHAAVLLYTTENSNSRVRVFNISENEHVTTVSVGDSPEGIAISGTGAFVVNSGHGTVSVIDVSNNQLVKTIAVGNSPFFVVISGTGAFVTNGGDDTVSVIDTTTLTVDRTVSVGDLPVGIATSGTGVFVANLSGNTVSVIDTTTLTVDRTVSVGTFPGDIQISGTGAFVANRSTDNVSVIDTTTLTVDRTISVGDEPRGMAASGTGVYVTNFGGDTVSVIDTTSLTVDRTISVGDKPRGAATSGTGVYVTNFAGDTVSVIDTTTLTVDQTISGFFDPSSLAFYTDSATLDPTLTIPATNSLCDDLTVAYTLPELPLAGSVQLQFYNETTHSSVTATLTNATGSVTFNLDLQDFTASANVASSTANSIIAGEYSVFLTYQDQFGNSAGEAEDTSFTVTACASSSSSSSSSTSSQTGGGGGGGTRPETLERKMSSSSSSSTSSSSSQSSSSRASSSVTPCRMTDNSTFSDVALNDWFCEHVKNVVSLKIFEGYKETDGTPKGLFGPADSITLGQLAKVGTILRNKEDISPKPTGDTWYEPYVGAVQAYDAQVFVGDIDPLANATRAEVVHTVLEALGIPMEGGVIPYDDVAKDHPYSTAIATATKLGIVSGDDDTKNFRPNDPVNRAEVAKIVALALAHVGIQSGDGATSSVSSSSSSVSSSSSSSTSSLVSSSSSSTSSASSSSSSSSSISWQTVGPRGFTTAAASNPKIAFDANGTQYIAFSDMSDVSGKAKITVMKFDGTNWVAVGAERFSVEDAGNPEFALASDGTPYVAFRDNLKQGKITVMKFNGTAWTYVGIQGFTTGDAEFISLAIAPDGNPYVAYDDGARQNKATVMKFNGSTWVTVGTPALSSGDLYHPSLGFNNGFPFLAYADGNHGGKITVKFFNGSQWLTVGAANFTDTIVYSVKLAFGANGVGYVAYLNSDFKPTVKFFNGFDWVTLGTPGFTSTMATNLSFALTGGSATTQGTPYVSFMDSNQKVSVMKLNLTNFLWEAVGSTVSDGKGFGPHLAIGSDGIPVVTYKEDPTGNNKITVKSYR